jgi:antitoxin component of MazEF toxin-antitoxin module
MTTKIMQWGNSKAVRIPQKILETTNFSQYDSIEIIPSGEEIILRKANKPKASDLFNPFFDTKGFKFDREDANAR